ncbi:hypothetical protein KEM52_000855 [Ascosphaera acerosa]|nr:hypothetical protein KEM52_000855 [Ascosphaera acerosa]
MSYLLYSITLFCFAVVTAIHMAVIRSNMPPRPAPTGLWFTRSRWLPHLPAPGQIYHRLPTSFAGDIEAGLTSAEFDLAGNNLAQGDARKGLDPQAKAEVLDIMRKRRVNFNEARRIYLEQRLAKHNIGPDGRPRDPKFVSFS